MIFFERVGIVNQSDTSKKKETKYIVIPKANVFFVRSFLTK
jgi:hypothetical protein